MSEHGVRANSDRAAIDVREIAHRVVDAVLRVEPAAEVEASVDLNRIALTRFANSRIHQNVAEDAMSITVRVHVDGRTTGASTTRLDDGGQRRLVERAMSSVRVAPLDPGWPGVGPPAAAPKVPGPDPATVAATPADRADLVRAFVDAAGGLETAGYCRTNHWTGAFANSAGHTISGERTEAGMEGIAHDHGADGAARAASVTVADLDGARLGARAAAKSRAAGEGDDVPPGRYEVVLEPSAASDVLQGIAMYGVNAKAVAERRSFVRLGENQFDAAVSLVDEGPAAGFVYDTEGTPRQRLVLVEAGTSVGLTHDRRTAAEAGVASTGSSVGMPSFGGFAMTLALLAPSSSGGADDAEVEGPILDRATAGLVADVARGLLVTDLWYTRVLDPRTLAVTGLTRNGLWLIEHGEVAKALRNLRFTQSYAEALRPGNVLGVGRFASAIPGDTYGTTGPRWSTPPLRLASWNITGGATG